MEIFSKLPQQLKELLAEAQISTAQLSQQIGIEKATVHRYLEGIRVPNFPTLVLLCEFFNCSADFLLGLTDYPKRENQTFLPVPPFATQFRTVLSVCNISQYALQKKTKISWANFNDWLNGKSVPHADNLVKLSNALDCTIDFLIGREK